MDKFIWSSQRSLFNEVVTTQEVLLLLCCSELLWIFEVDITDPKFPGKAAFRPQMTRNQPKIRLELLETHRTRQVQHGWYISNRSVQSFPNGVDGGVTTT